MVNKEAKRWNVINAGRRWGKSLFFRDKLIEIALQGKPVAWFSPTNKFLADSWREMKATLVPITVEKKEDDHRIEILGGGSIEMWSLESDDAGRSRKYARVVVDEAAMVSKLQTFWEANIRPTLTDYCGDAWIGSTPKGFNYYKILFDRGPDPQWPDWMSWQLPTSTNPYISTVEIEDARRGVTEAFFNQEYLAMFVNWEGTVFRNVVECATAEHQDVPIPGHKYVIGVDWGRSKDYTVFMVIDETTHSIAHYDRSNKVDYSIQRDRLRVLRDKWRPKTIIAESNSIGEPIIEQLETDGVRVERFVTSNSSKQEAIQLLALSFERMDIKVLNDPVLVGELQSFRGEQLPSGLMRYGAPEGENFHDDCVMSLAVGWFQIANGMKFGVLDYMKSEFDVVKVNQNDKKLVAKVATSSAIKPEINSQTNVCPECKSPCLITIGTVSRCNQCGLQTDSFKLPQIPNRSNVGQFHKGIH